LNRGTLGENIYYQKMSDTPILRRFLPDYVSEDIRGTTVQHQGGKSPGGETGSPLLVPCVMRRRTGTSAPSALPVRIMAAKIFLSTNRKSTFLSLFLSHQWRIFKSLFDAVDPKFNTFMSVVIILK